MANAPTAALQPPSVLVVEDEIFTRMAAVDLLDEIGLDHIEAGDADEALQMLACHPEVSLIFTDVNMPGSMDGLGLARRAREMRPDVDIILTSAVPPQSEASMPRGGTFLPKPYWPRQLAEAVRRKLVRRNGV
jgi:CheY-like chemotaxis protein